MISTQVDMTKWSSSAQLCRTHIDCLACQMEKYDGSNSGQFAQGFHLQLDEIERLSVSCPDERRSLVEYALLRTSAELSQSKLHQQGRAKPFGYAGDFQVIDWTYTKACSSTARGRIWDLFYHDQIASRAVCDRKDRFGTILAEVASLQISLPLRILNVASGPCREIADGVTYAGLSPNDARFTCLEIDAKAVEYAKSVLGAHWSPSVDFRIGNALRFRTSCLFELVWCAGLFDYLNSRIAVLLLRRLWRCLAPGGQLWIGNFSSTHSTRPWIEWLGDWELIHRTQEEMHQLAEDSGIPSSLVEHHIDHLKVIRYLKAQKPADYSDT